MTQNSYGLLSYAINPADISEGREGVEHARVQNVSLSIPDATMCLSPQGAKPALPQPPGKMICSSSPVRSRDAGIGRDLDVITHLSPRGAPCGIRVPWYSGVPDNLFRKCYSLFGTKGQDRQHSWYHELELPYTPARQVPFPKCEAV